MTYTSNSSGSHLPLLIELLYQVTPGPILELGSGYFSTPILYWYSKANDQLFKSYENNLTWTNIVGPPTKYVTSWEDVNFYETYWRIVFIDHGDGKARKEHALLLKDNSDFIILHDSEDEEEHFYGYKSILNEFNYVFNYDKVSPNTLILSNTTDLSFLNE